MKLKNLLAMTAIALLTASCSDDDNNGNESINPAVNVAGTYAGYSEAAFQYTDTPLVSADESLTIQTADESLTIQTDADNTTATITYTSSSFGEFTISGTKVTYASGTYTLSGEGSTMMGMSGNVSEYECTLKGTLNEYECTLKGTLNEAKNEGTFTFNVPAVMGGMNITFTLGEIPVSKLLAGSYEGWTEASCAYFEGMQATDQTLSLTANADDTFTLAYTSDSWGEFSFESLSVTSANGIYTLSGKGVTMMGMDGNVSEYPCTVTGSIDANKENVSFTFTVPGVMGGLTITFTQGEAPAANE